MSKFVAFFKSSAFILVSLIALGCSPYDERPGQTLNEIRISEPDAIKAVVASNSKLVEGNIFIEVQNDLISGQTKAYAQVVFYKPVARNILFSEISTASVEGNLYSGTIDEKAIDSHSPGSPPGSDGESGPGTPPGSDRP